MNANIVIPINRYKVDSTSDKVESTGDKVESIGDKAKSTGDKMESTGDKVESAGNNSKLFTICNKILSWLPELLNSFVRVSYQISKCIQFFINQFF